MYSTAAFASPAQDAQDFAAQFKKEPAVSTSVKETSDTFGTEITTINETPDKPIEIFGEGVDPSYKYIPEENDDVSIPPSAIANGPKFSFDFQGTPLTSALYAIGRLSHANILLVDKSDLNEAKVYATLKNVTAEEAISYLCGSYDLNYTFENDSFRISADEDTMLQTQRYNVRFADKEKLVNELKALGIDEKNIYANDGYSTVTVTANSYQLSQAEKLIASVDKPVAQAMIVAQLIETTHTKDLDAGLNYTMPTYTNDVDDPLSHQNWLTKMTFGVTSSLNESISKGKVLSRPIIITENGHEAELFMGDRVPIPQTTTSDGSTNITFDYQDVGNTLKIKPSIDKKSGIVSLDIGTQIKNITKYIEQGGMQAPQIASREAKTIAHLKSGQAFAIGGLMSKEV